MPTRTLLRSLLLLAAAPLVVGAGPAPAPTAASGTAVICAAVKDRAPVGAADKFPATVGQLTCFSELHGVKDKAVHVWFHGDKEVARMELAVRAERWRTWSTKTIPPKWTGAWKVEIQDASGAVLATAAFTVE
ncbi:MAG TPA: DUF2914 domain-containing protein [Thermoanaerobaculaceae bacterium]|nr:DUF2914 domain-containing protein [Thermoanaerobaculaceae bacterium]